MHLTGDRLVLGDVEDRAQLIGERLDIAGLHGDERVRHARQPVRVEVVDRIDQPRDRITRARQHDHVALAVNADDRAVRRERLDDLGDLVREGIAQRHDPDTVAGTNLTARYDGHGRAGFQRLIQRHDVIGAIGHRDDREAIELESTFDGGQDRIL